MPPCFSYYCAAFIAFCHAAFAIITPIFASRFAILDAFIAYADICCFFTFATSDFRRRHADYSAFFLYAFFLFLHFV